MHYRKLFFAAGLIILLLTAACDDATMGGDSLLSQKIAVDPTFIEFYNRLGGEEILGPAISPLFTYRNVYYQYTVSSVMVYDPGAPASQTRSLGTLGVDMGISDAPVSKPENSDLRYVSGHVIYPLFLPLYEKLGGLRFVGEPLTEVHYNPEKGRYEQYFASLGFYWLEGEPLDSIHLLAYGAWKCDVHCRSSVEGPSNVVLPFRTSKRFSASVERLDARFTGYAITDEYSTPDGFVEQVFENVVLVLDPKQPGRVFPRSLTQRLGYRPDPLQERPVESEDYFYPIVGDRGYIVPHRFYDYLSQHGSFDISGPPIGGVARIKDTLFQQCYTNLCIQAFLDAMGEIVVRPAPLGYTYRLLPVDELNQPGANPSSPGEGTFDPVLSAPEQSDVPAEPPAEDRSEPEPFLEEQIEPTLEIQAQPADVPAAAPDGPVTVQVWEGLPMVSPSQSQEIGVSVFQGGQPVANVEPDLTVSLPDGTQQTYYMLPTGPDGQSRQIIEPVAAENGTLVPYEVCIYDLGGAPLCVRDTFLIWSSP